MTGTIDDVTADESGQSWRRPAIRPARPEDLPQLVAVEAAADRVFADVGVGPLPSPATIAAFADARAILVAGDPPVGFARMEEVDGSAHLEQLSVHPDHARRGIGARLLAAACEWAWANGHAAVTLITFADIPWNGPFYARHGFTPLTNLSPGLRALRQHEQAVGLDALGTRLVMRRTRCSAGRVSSWGAEDGTPS